MRICIVSSCDTEANNLRAHATLFKCSTKRVPNKKFCLTRAVPNDRQVSLFSSKRNILLKRDIQLFLTLLTLNKSEQKTCDIENNRAANKGTRFLLNVYSISVSFASIAFSL